MAIEEKIDGKSENLVAKCKWKIAVERPNSSLAEDKQKAKESGIKLRFDCFECDGYVTICDAYYNSKSQYKLKNL